MDPFTITAGALGITDFAVSRIVQLHDFVNDLAQAEEVLQHVASNLEGIQLLLKALEALSISDEGLLNTAKEDLKKTGVVKAVNDCGQACDRFSKNLKKWTEHSGSAKLSLRDRLSVGVWNKEKIRTFKTQVQSCQTIVQFAVASTQWIVQYRSEKQSETDRQDLKQQLQTLEIKIQEHLNLTEEQRGENQKRKEELQEEPEDEDDDGAQRALALQEVEEQSRLLKADQESSRVVLSQVHSQVHSQLTRQEVGNVKTSDQESSRVVFSQVRSQVHSQLTRQEIGNVKTSDQSQAFVGLPESVVGKINQRIGDVTTETRSFSAVGVFNKDIVTAYR